MIDWREMRTFFLALLLMGGLIVFALFETALGGLSGALVALRGAGTVNVASPPAPITPEVYIGRYFVNPVLQIRPLPQSIFAPPVQEEVLFQEGMQMPVYLDPSFQTYGCVVECGNGDFNTI